MKEIPLTCFMQVEIAAVAVDEGVMEEDQAPAVSDCAACLIGNTDW